MSEPNTNKISRRRFLKLLGYAGILGLASSYPVLIERYIVLVNTYQIPVPNLPPAFNGFRIVHLTDFHYGFLVQQSFIQSIIDRTNRIGRDVIVCTGDFVHKKQTTHEIDSVWPLLSKLNARHGVYSVLGNHDHWADAERSRYWLNQAGQDLHHKTVQITRNGERLWIAGAGDFIEDHKSLDDLLDPIPKSDCRIVLAHNPDTADSEYSSRTDLIISGHTHGGQVNIPFIGAPILPVKNKNYSSGLKYSPRGSGVFISRGIGWAILPVRFNCLPEIAVLELVAVDKVGERKYPALGWIRQ
jgi:uncharacterized protein